MTHKITPIITLFFILAMLFTACNEKEATSTEPKVNYSLFDLKETNIRLGVPKMFNSCTTKEYIELMRSSDVTDTAFFRYTIKYLEFVEDNVTIFYDPKHIDNHFYCMYGNKIEHFDIKAENVGYGTSYLKAQMKESYQTDSSYIDFKSTKLFSNSQSKLLKIDGEIKYSYDENTIRFIDIFFLSTDRSTIHIISSTAKDLELQEYLNFTRRKKD